MALTPITAAQRKKARGMLLGVKGGSVAWTPTLLASCRAYWARGEVYDDYPSDPSDEASEAVDVWRSATGSYHLDVVNGSPIVATSAGGPLVFAGNTTRCIGTTPAALPADSAATIGFIARIPVNLGARDFDAVVSFTDTATAYKQLHFCLRRLDASTMVMGFASQLVTGASNYSSWRGSTNLTAGQYYRVIYRLTGSALEIYVNGELETLTNDLSAGPTIGQWLDVVSCNCIVVGGRRFSSGYSEMWNSQIDNPVWFGQALQANDLANLDAWLAARQGEID